MLQEPAQSSAAAAAAATAAGTGAAAPGSSNKEVLAAQIAVKAKVLKLLKKQSSAADATTKARLQHKIDTVLGKAAAAAGASAGAGAGSKPSSSVAAAAAAAAAASGGGSANGSMPAASRAALQQRQQHGTQLPAKPLAGSKQQRQSAAGAASALAVTPVRVHPLAVTPAELVSGFRRAWVCVLTH